MATMHPPTLRDGAASRSEETVFALLRDGLPEPWEVFHGVDVLARAGAGAGAADASDAVRARPDPSAPVKDGEIDFVLVHPDEPVICLEVKGGGLETVGGAWYRRPKGGPRERAEDPFRQAADHKFELLRALEQHRTAAARRLEEAGLPVPARRQAELLTRLPERRDLRVVHALALPDVPVHGLVLGADAPPEIVLDPAGLRDVEASLARVLEYWRGRADRRRPPGPEGVAALRELFAPTQVLRTVLAAEFVDEHRQLVELTRNQTRAMRTIASHPHVAVRGCAGSGKTMLAVAHAQRLAEQDRDVLVCCFNRSLAEHLERVCPHERVTYATFHGLCVRVAAAAGLAVPQAPEGGFPAEHWSRGLADLLLEALVETGPRWDALLVDEAQDFRQRWLDALRLGLRGGEAAPTWLFLDDRQRLYDVDELRVPAGFLNYDLLENCRTTQAIHRELVALREAGVDPAVVTGDGGLPPLLMEPESVGPEGRPIEVVRAADEPAAVREVVERLLDREGVRPSDLVLLTPRRAERSRCVAAVGERAHTGRPADRPAHLVQASSIGAYKGLEADVVVACELGEAREGTADAHRYVALSRARHHVVEVRATD